MNYLSFISFLIGVAVLIGGLYLSSKDMMIFYDMTSLFLVLGGTFAATAISFELDRIIYLCKIVFYRIFGKKAAEYKMVIIELMKLADAYRKGPAQCKIQMQEINNPFLREAMEALLDETMEVKDLIRLLKKRVDNMDQLYVMDANKIKSIGKYPPAFGMMGTTIGMIVLLSNLGGADAAKSIGPAMSICLITTLYGVVLSNLIIIPFGENLLAGGREKNRTHRLIVEGIRLIAMKTNPVILAEELNSYVLPSQRVDWKNVST